MDGNEKINSSLKVNQICVFIINIQFYAVPNNEEHYQLIIMQHVDCLLVLFAMCMLNAEQSYDLLHLNLTFMLRA